MNENDLYESIGQVDEDLLCRSEKNKIKKKWRKPWWIAATAALIAITFIGGVLLNTKYNSLQLSVAAISEAEYPKTAPYPQEKGYADGTEAFFEKSIQQFLSNSGGENCAYSPLNVYMALGMMAELTEGESRQQILDLVGEKSIEDLRIKAKSIWNANYRNDNHTTSILASSLWIDEDISIVPSTLKNLSETYYASSYQGKMGSKNFDKAFQYWINKQTGGLLKKQKKNLKLDSETVMSLATTVYFKAKWDEEFEKENTYPAIFYALNEDISCDFMHSSSSGTYYWSDKFSAIKKGFKNGGEAMWFILPDKENSIEDILNDSKTMDFILSNGDWENNKDVIINLFLPKFDITSKIDLKNGLKELGVKDIFDDKKADFSPMTKDVEGISVSKAEHNVRVAIDEEGVTATAYTDMKYMGATMPPEDEVYFILDRPFLFVITNNDGLPMFVGSVYNPK